MKDSELSIVTEVGNFGEMPIEDPTQVSVKQKKKTTDELIKEAVAENAANLTE